MAAAVVRLPNEEEAIKVQKNPVIDLVELDKRAHGAIKCCNCDEILTCEAVSPYISVDCSTGKLEINFKEGFEGLHCNSPEVSCVSER